MINVKFCPIQPAHRREPVLPHMYIASWHPSLVTMSYEMLACTSRPRRLCSPLHWREAACSRCWLDVKVDLSAAELSRHSCASLLHSKLVHYLISPIAEPAPLLAHVRTWRNSSAQPVHFLVSLYGFEALGFSTDFSVASKSISKQPIDMCLCLTHRISPWQFQAPYLCSQ